MFKHIHQTNILEMRAFFLPQATIHRIYLVVPEQFSNELKKKKSHVHRQFSDEPSCVYMDVQR